jgi:CheY-like chemotaxis protein
MSWPLLRVIRKASNSFTARLEVVVLYLKNAGDGWAGVSQVCVGTCLSPRIPPPSGGLKPRPADAYALLRGKPMIGVLLVDDHPVMRQLLRDTLERYTDLSIVGEAESGEDAVAQATALQPSVVIMDINLPTMNGIQATKLIKLRSPSTAVIGLTAGDQGHAKAMIAAGAAALIQKDDVLEALYPSILEAVKRPMSQV